MNPIALIKNIRHVLQSDANINRHLQMGNWGEENNALRQHRYKRTEARFFLRHAKRQDGYEEVMFTVNKLNSAIGLGGVVDDQSLLITTKKLYVYKGLALLVEFPLTSIRALRYFIKEGRLQLVTLNHKEYEILTSRKKFQRILCYLKEVLY
eukprot:TRINITY_DN11823_c0_g2_i2.p2 TRINITY_DN11823_c0_g2~~TRINITY_DN11823_c0_g2_i2.p2  ORF type:complete len:152 (-),score=23.37 TRINITY_DN11823_c0_g2_i2:265-720(-)